MRDEHNMHGTAKGHGRHRVHGKHESRRTSPRPAHLLGVVAALTLVGGTLLAVQVFPDNRPPSATAATATATTPRRSADEQSGRHGQGVLPPALAPTSRGSGCLATPGTDGEVEVVEQILLPTPSTQLRFGPAATAAIPGLQDLQPVLHQIQATADGQVVAVPSADAIDRPVDVTLAAAGDRDRPALPARRGSAPQPACAAGPRAHRARVSHDAAGRAAGRGRGVRRARAQHAVPTASGQPTALRPRGWPELGHASRPVRPGRGSRSGGPTHPRGGDRGVGPTTRRDGPQNPGPESGRVGRYAGFCPGGPLPAFRWRSSISAGHC